MDTVSQHPAAQKLKRFLAPRSIVVMGGLEAGRVIRQCERLGFEGAIWPVNPKRETLEGHTCYATLDDLPGVPDAGFIAVPREATVDAVRALSEMGAGGAVCYASGFAETGAEGIEHQQALLDAAGAMPIIGPNCYGCVNALERLALWPDNQGLSPIEEGAAIITQSGNMGINFTMSKRGLPLACLLSLGNQAQMKVTDCLEALLDDPRIKAIGLHIEGVDDVARFSRAAIRALDQGVPLVAFKTGASEKGAQATVSHTSTLAGSDALYDAFFERYGIARVHSVTAFLETLKLLTIIGPIDGNEIASLSCSGGEASLMADRAEGTGLVFPDLKPAHARKVSGTLNAYVDITNPLDYHTFIWGNRKATQATFDAMLSGGFDMTLLVLDFPNNDGADLTDWNMTFDVFAAAANARNANAAVLATVPECLSEDAAHELARRGVAPMAGVDDALTATAAAAMIGAKSKQKRPAPLKPAAAPANQADTLDEWRAKQLLAEYGLSVPSGDVTTPSKAASVARDIGFPVALKAVGADIAHKTEIGAVKLNLSSQREVREAAKVLAAHSPELLVERMAQNGVAELIIGIARDAQFGPHLVIGAGGVLVEVMKDARTLLLPTTRRDIREAILSLKAAPLLTGFRGRSPADITAAVDAAWAVAKFARKHWTTVQELDINPLIVLEKGKGAVAADALIRLAQGDKT